MKINILVILLGIFFLFACEEEGMDPGSGPGVDDNFPADVEIGDSKVPYIIIDTDGIAIENEPKVPATMSIYVEKELVQPKP